MTRKVNMNSQTKVNKKGKEESASGDSPPDPSILLSLSQERFLHSNPRLEAQPLQILVNPSSGDRRESRHLLADTVGS